MAVVAAPKARSPYYYIKRRLLQNKPAMAGLAVIVLATLVSLAGYLILPDSTPDANNGLVQLQKKSPGFTVKLLKVKKSPAPPESNFLEFMISGRESKYHYIPFSSYRITGDSLTVQPLKSNNPLADQAQTFTLSEVVHGKARASHVNQPENALAEKIESEQITIRTYWLGTDKAGRDVLSRLLLGTRISLSIGFIAVLISLAVGITIGALGGYFGGTIDKFAQFLMTVVWSVPGIMLVIAISLALNSKGVWVSFVAVGLTMWVDVARVVRGQILSLKEKTYIEAAKVLGIPQHTIIRKHLLPNMLGPLIVIATANFAAAILMEAGLSFLGLGVQPPTPSWGMMVNEGFQLIGSKAGLFLVILPSACISLLVLCFNLLGNGLRDAYDPKIPLTNA